MKPIFLQAMMGFGMLFMGCCVWVLILLIGMVSIRADSLADAEVKRKKSKEKDHRYYLHCFPSCSVDDGYGIRGSPHQLSMQDIAKAVILPKNQ